MAKGTFVPPMVVSANRLRAASHSRISNVLSSVSIQSLPGRSPDSVAVRLSPELVQTSSGFPAMAESGVDSRNPRYAACRSRQRECAVQGTLSEHARLRPRKHVSLAHDMSG